jgi:3-oxoacyl-[acyl-carrier protein] reductase
MSIAKPSFDELAGRVVLVTGGSTGIGAAVARGFAACGARVCVHYNASSAAADAVVGDIAAAGGDAFVEAADLSQPGTAGRLVQSVAARAGRLDVLVNNAGTVFARRPTAEIDDAFYRRVIDLNLTAVFEACRAAIPIFRRQKRGTIINTSSLAARMGGGPGTVIYGAAKAGVSTLTRGLSRELAPDGIRVNAVAPGFIHTALHDRFSPPEVIEAFIKSIPLGRAGFAEDLVGTYLFLACESLSGFITGQTIEVNGGNYMP